MSKKQAKEQDKKKAKELAKKPGRRKEKASLASIDSTPASPIGKVKTTDIEVVAASPSELISYDENLLERSRTQWQFGDWESLAKLERETLQHHPDRAKLALLAAAGHQQLGNMATARQLIRLAQEWGCSKRLVSKVLISGVYNTLGRLAALLKKESKVVKNFKSTANIDASGSDTRLLKIAQTQKKHDRLDLADLTTPLKYNKITYINKSKHADNQPEKNLSPPHQLKEKIFWWSKDNQTLNIGDDISPIIVDRILQLHGIDINISIPRTKLLAIGSILHFAQDGDCIWGTGINGKIPADAHKFKTLDIRAVRGPLSRNFLLNRNINTPEIYGDPAILLPIFFPPAFFTVTEKAEERVDFLIVPHISEDIAQYNKFGKSRVLTPSTPHIDFIKKILTANLVISSSLHGIIIAESYGIPAIWLKGNNKETEFKYKDYYLGTNRSADSIMAASVEGALKLTTQPISCLANLQTNLIKTFPIDIWNNKNIY